MGNVKTAQAVTFDIRSLVESFLLDYATMSPRTLQHYTDNVGRVFVQWLEAQGVRDLLDITPATMRAYMRDQAQLELSRHTLSHRFQRAYRFFRWCAEQGYLGEADNPMRSLPRPKLSKRGRQAFSREDVRRLYVVLKAKPGWIGARDRAIVTVLLGTGIRAQELVGMLLSDIEWPQKRILIRGKGDKDRRVGMGSGTMAALRDYLKVRPREPWPFVWLSQRGGPMKYGAAEVMVRHLGEYAAVDPCHLHRFRHTFAQEFYLANRDIIALKNRLGHENIEVTMRYVGRLGVDYGGQDSARTPDEWLS